MKLTPRWRAWPALVWLTPLLVAATWLRALRLGDQSVWWDEGLAVWAARQSLAASAAWTAADVHPPLYFWLLHFWRTVSGDGEFALRWLSVLIGVLTVPAAYLVGRRVGGRTAGLLAALLVTLSAFAVTWSQELRMYALSALWAALAVWAALRVWDRGRAGDFVVYTLTMAAGLWTLYLFATVLFVVNLTWLIWVWPRAARRPSAAAGAAGREFWRWSGAQAAVLALFAPWLAYALGRIPTWSAATPVNPGDFVKIYWTVLTVGATTEVDGYAAFTLPVLAVALAGLIRLAWRADWRRGRDLTLLGAGLVLPAGVVYLVSLPKDFFFYSPPLAPRYLLVFIAAYSALLGWGLAALGRGRFWPVGLAGLAVCVTAAGVGLAGYYPGRLRGDDYPSLVRTLAAQRHPGDAVVLVTDQDWPIFAYHYPAEWRGVPHAWQLTPAQADQYLAPLWDAHAGLWLVVTPYASVSDPDGTLEAWLAERALATLDFAFQDKRLRFYARTPERAASLRDLAPDAAPQHPLDGALSGARLVGFDQAVRELRPGDTLFLGLYWQNAAASPPLELGLSDAAGRTWLAQPVTPPAGPGRTRQSVAVPLAPDLPAGEYALSVRAADGSSVRLGAVRVRASTWAATSAEVTIPNSLVRDFAVGVRLLGYGLEPTQPQAGQTLRLTLYWQAAAPVTQRYKVFTHLVGAEFNPETGSQLWAQKDNEPVADTRPTTTWRKGEVIVDEYALPISAGAPPGDYRLLVGLYDPATGERALVRDEAGAPATDHVILVTITLGRP